ncbi:MAG: hypothetical protein LBD52_02365 [Prevotellaceae bacterium]|jgi:hypothetical protein|nr:hypothetical protein [Prevotellaceae bacterium]
MDTLLLQVNNRPALNLLYEMQALNLVKVLKEYPLPQTKTKLSDRYRGVFSKEAGKSFKEHTQLLREEWNNT